RQASARGAASRKPVSPAVLPLIKQTAASRASSLRARPRPSRSSSGNRAETMWTSSTISSSSVQARSATFEGTACPLLLDPAVLLIHVPPHAGTPRGAVEHDGLHVVSVR